MIEKFALVLRIIKWPQIRWRILGLVRCLFGYLSELFFQQLRLMSQSVVSFSARQMVYHVASSTCSYSSSIMFENWSFVTLGPELKTETRMAMARLSKGWRIRGTQSSISYERKRIGRSNFSDKQRPLRRIKLHWCGAFCLFVSSFETNFFDYFSCNLLNIFLREFEMKTFFYERLV